MVLNGRFGEIHDVDIPAGMDLLADGGLISDQTPETSKPQLYKLGIQAPEGTIVRVNNIDVKIGLTHIFELDQVVNVTSLIFPNGADSSVIIDYVY